MSNKLVLVDVDYNISLLDVTEEEMASSEGTYTARQYERSLQSFQKILDELVRMGTDNEYRTENAAELLRVNGVWLHNLAKTGFAIEYAQYRRNEMTVEAGTANCGCVNHAEQGIPCEHDIAIAKKQQT